MSSIKDRLNEPAPSRPGIGGELRQLRENGQASADELRAFLRTVRGKSPQEVMGVVAQSGLASSIILATIGCVVLLVVFSVIPYFANQSAGKSESPKVAAPEKTEPEKPEQPAAPANEAAAQAAPDADPNPGAPDPSLPDKLGIGETKEADPKKNPLDGDIDNLLDGID